MSRILLVLCTILFWPYQALSAGAPNPTMEKLPQQAPGFQTKPLSPQNKVAFQPAFVIGGIIPSRAGFQPCISLPGFIGIWSDLEKKWYPRSDHPCAVGNVTVTQTNRLLNPTGKKVRLLVTSVDYMIYTFGPFSELSIYELPLPNNYVTFQVVFASGKNLERAYDGVSDKNYLNQVFAQGKPLKIEALYDGTSYATLNCTFRSPNKVDCP